MVLNAPFFLLKKKKLSTETNFPSIPRPDCSGNAGVFPAETYLPLFLLSLFKSNVVYAARSRRSLKLLREVHLTEAQR